MDFQRPQIKLPLEKELIPFKIKEKINLLSRQELEEYLVESSSLLIRLSAQTATLLDYIEELEGKILGIQ
jgi:hypothetical protein